MKIINGEPVIKKRYLFFGCISITLFSQLLVSGVFAGKAESNSLTFEEFRKAINSDNDEKAARIGNSIFEKLKQKYRNDSGFRTLDSKLRAARFLAERMKDELQNKAFEKMKAVTDEPPESGNDDNEQEILSVLPAKKFYQTSTSIFSRKVSIAGLSHSQKAFIAKYYHLRLRLLTSSLATAGQALVVADPDFEGTYDYVLVLPLLHCTKKKPIIIEVLPGWMQKPEHLHRLSDSALLHFGLPFQARILAEEAARINGRAFSELNFYRKAAARCSDSKPHIAAECLRNSMQSLPDSNTEKRVRLHFELVQLWLDSGNYALASGDAREIFQSFPSHPQAGKAIWLYFYALARNNQPDRILAGIDAMLNDERAKQYEPKLMYIKWWALRRKRNQQVIVEALEYELLKQYPNNPLVAPILLSRATDKLASQNYNDAYITLQELINKFPKTESAKQAKRILKKVKDVH